MRVPDDMPVDVVDNSNAVIGTLPRRELLVRHANFRTVHIVLKAHRDLVVLQKLPNDHPRSPNKLGSSVAGYLYAGETYKAAAERKLFDELRSAPKIVLLGRFVMNDDASRKFVAVYMGSLSVVPDFDRDQIAGLVYMDANELAVQFQSNPNQFTETFQYAYRAFGPRFVK